MVNIIKKIGNPLIRFNKWLGLKRYCSRCIYIVGFIEGFKNYLYSEDREKDDGKNICRKTIRLYKTEVGETKMKVYKDLERCDKCGLIVHDASVIRYGKCIDKNVNFKCKDFTPKLYIKLFYRGT